MTHFTARTRRILRNSAVALALMAITATPAFAKGKHHRKKMQNMTEQERLEHMENKLDKRMKKISKKLALSDQQANQVRGILSAAQTEKHDIRSRFEGDREGAKPEMQALRARTQDELKRVLTQDQYTKLESMRSTHHAEKREHKATRRLKRMAKKLDLSEQQIAQIKEIHEDRRVQAKELIDQAGSKEAARPELKALRQSSHQQVEALLTPDQLEKFEDMKKNRRQRRKSRDNK